MVFKKNKLIIQAFGGGALLFVLFLITNEFLLRPKLNLVSIDLINKIINLKVSEVKVGDTVLLLKNADEDCNLGSVEAISVANNKTHLISIQKRENEYVYLFRIKVISGKKITCSPEVTIKLF